MSNVVDFFLRLKDMFSPSMRAAARLSDSSAARIQRSMGNTARAGREMGMSLKQAHDRLKELDNIRLSTRNIETLRATTREIRALERQIARVEGRGSGGGAGLGGMLGGLGKRFLVPAALGAGLLMGGRSAVNNAMELEQTRTSFQVMLGGEQSGNQMVDKLRKMGASTPFESKDLYDNAQVLLQFGTAGEKVLPTLQMLGDVSGGNKQRLQSLTLAFAQVSAAGRLAGQDLLQMINGGFNPLKVMSEATGKKMADLKAIMEDGGISAEMVEAAFKKATGAGGQFYGMMDKQSQTLSGRMSTFSDSVRELSTNIGNWLAPAVSGVVDWFGRLVNKVNGWFEIPLEKKVHDEIIQIRTLGIQLSQTNIPTERRRNLLKQLAEINPNIVKGITAEAFEYSKLAENIEKVTSALKTKLIMQKQEEVIKDMTSDFDKLQKQQLKEEFKAAEIMARFQERYPSTFKKGFSEGDNMYYNAGKLAEQIKKEQWHEGNGRVAGFFTGGTSSTRDEIKRDYDELLQFQRTTESILKSQQALEPTMKLKQGALNTFMAAHKDQLSLVTDTPAPATATTDPNKVFDGIGKGGKDKDKGKSKDAMAKTADQITGGGSRVITIHVNKMIDQITLQSATVTEGVSDVERIVKEALLRLLYSVNEMPG